MMNREYWNYLHKIKQWNKGQLTSKQVEQMARYFTDPEFDLDRLSKANRNVLVEYTKEVSCILFA